MLSTYMQARSSNPARVRVALIVGFVALTALTARITLYLPGNPVPITLQVMAVLLAGLTLGAKDGALSQIFYLAGITLGLPLDANGLGAAVWAAPTAGYLIGFVGGAWAAGYLAERGLHRKRAWRFAAGLLGVGVIYFTGSLWLTYGFLGGDWGKGWALGIAPFIVLDIVKALSAAVLAEGLRTGLRSSGDDHDQ